MQPGFRRGTTRSRRLEVLRAILTPNLRLPRGLRSSSRDALVEQSSGPSASGPHSASAARPRGRARRTPARARVDQGQHRRRRRSLRARCDARRERRERGHGMKRTPSPCARPRAVARPIRRPVKVPGPTPTAIAVTSSQPVPALLEQRGEHRQQLGRVRGRRRAAAPGRAGPCETARPSARITQAVVTAIEVSKPMSVTLERRPAWHAPAAPPRRLRSSPVAAQVREPQLSTTRSRLDLRDAAPGHSTNATVSGAR